MVIPRILQALTTDFPSTLTTAGIHISLPALRTSMELSTTSQPSTSPTDGDNPCGMDVTNLAIDGATLLICLCGLAGNGAVIWLLGFRMQRSPITVYIFHLAVINFLFLLFVVPCTVLSLQADVVCSAAPSLQYLMSCFLLSLFSCNTGMYLLMAISIERFISTLCPLRCHCHRPQCLSEVVNVLIEVLSIAVIATVASPCLTHQYEHCRVSLISMFAINLFLFAPAVVISSTILFIKAKCGSKQQQLKKLNIVIFLSVLFSLPFSLCNFLQQLSYTIVSSQVAFLLACINSASNSFICLCVGSWRRPCSIRSLQLSLQRVLGEPEEDTASSNDSAVDAAL